MQLTMERSIRPWLDSDYLFGLSALGRENDRCVKVLHDFTNQVYIQYSCFLSLSLSKSKGTFECQVIRDRKKMLLDNNNEKSLEEVKTETTPLFDSPSKSLYSPYAIQWLIHLFNT